MMRPAEYVARRARDIIDRGWTQGCAARDAKGRPVEYYEDEARRFCTVSAVYCAAMPLAACVRHEPIGAVLGAIARHAGIASPPLATNLVTWNDAPSRQVNEVLAAFDAAVAELSERAAA